MLPVFFLTLREGLEAALIIGIVLAYLQRTGRQQFVSSVWSGLLAALVFCAVGGTLIFMALGGLSDRALKLFEGIACLSAAVILTAVIVWMHRNARNLGKELRAAVDTAVESSSNSKHSWALFGLIFVTVGREGLETILILPGMRSSAELSSGEMTAGIVSGLALAIVLGVAFHRGSKVLDLQRFFRYTGVLLIFFAAGLVAYGIHELQSAGSFPVVVKEVWNTNGVLYEKEGFGLLLKGLFGYNGNPSLIEVICYFTYLIVSLRLFLKPHAPTPKAAA